MKLSEAKEIISAIIEWQFVCNGIKERSEVKLIDLSKLTLKDLIQANRMVGSNNKRIEKLAKYHADKGHKTKGYTTRMVLADRLIAAVYTAISFQPDGEVIALINDIGVGCVRVSYDKQP